MDEIGKNLTVFEYGNDIIIVDCGLAFPDDEMLGVDLVIPDIAYLVKNKDKIRGMVLTHAHEDHIGALPYVLREIDMPIYGTRFTLGLVTPKLKEHGLAERAALKPITHGNVVRLGVYSVEFIRSNHSIPDVSCLAITTPVGVVFHTGDFKIDTTPIGGNMIDLARIGEIGRQGVLVMMSDSTN
ncbi:MAG: ribonuclease J, partial [Clostridiaceae bacterium]|nr:ribonuclease J [Clostridiaceae bacterium]